MDNNEVIKFLFGTRKNDRADALFPLLYIRYHYLHDIESIGDYYSLEFLESYFKELMELILREEEEKERKGINANKVSI